MEDYIVYIRNKYFCLFLFFLFTGNPIWRYYSERITDHLNKTAHNCNLRKQIIKEIK